MVQVRNDQVWLAPDKQKISLDSNLACSDLKQDSIQNYQVIKGTEVQSFASLQVPSIAENIYITDIRGWPTAKVTSTKNNDANSRKL